MKKLIFIILTFCLSNISIASSVGVYVENGFVSGSNWLSLSNNERSLYTVGVIDGLKFSPVLAFGEEKITKLNKCIAPMTAQQIRVIAENYVHARPEKWHEPVHFMIFASIVEVCKVFKK